MICDPATLLSGDAGGFYMFKWGGHSLGVIVFTDKEVRPQGVTAFLEGRATSLRLMSAGLLHNPQCLSVVS